MIKNLHVHVKYKELHVCFYLFMHILKLCFYNATNSMQPEIYEHNTAFFIWKLLFDIHLPNNRNSHNTIILLPVLSPILRVSKSFFISTCIHARPAQTSKQATSRMNTSMDVQVEHSPEPLLEKQIKSSALNLPYLLFLTKCMHYSY